MAAWDEFIQAQRDLVIAQHARKREERRLARDDELFDLSQQIRAKVVEALLGRMFETVMEVDDDGKPIKVLKPTNWRFADIGAMAKIYLELRDQATGWPGLEQTPDPRTPRGRMFVEAPRDGPLTVDVEEVTREPDPSTDQPQSSQPPFPKLEEIES